MTQGIELHVIKVDGDIDIDEKDMGAMQCLSIAESLRNLSRDNPEACQQLLRSVLMEAGEFASGLAARFIRSYLADMKDHKIESQLPLRKAQHDMACGLLVMAYASTRGDFAKMFDEILHATDGQELVKHPFYAAHVEAHTEAALKATRK